MIGIIDYNMGNLQSVKNSCEFLGAETIIIKNTNDFEKCSRLILPGVGSFREGMHQLDVLGLAAPLKKAAFEDKKPLLGICLGMQLLAEEGTEGGETQGLGLIPGRVERFEEKDLRIPHMGWNNIKSVQENPLVSDSMNVDYYFVHSYYFNAKSQEYVIATCDYGFSFPCIVGKDSVWGVQFHPEKSHQYGLKLLKNFMEMECLKSV